MMNDHLIDQPTAAEQLARAEWKLLLARLKQGPAADLRLQHLRRAIASGEFHIDAHAIAERLIARLLAS